MRPSGAISQSLGSRSRASSTIEVHEREVSADSRFTVGYVPEENLVGRANLVFFSIAGKASPLEIWKWPSLMRASRLFHFVN